MAKFSTIDKLPREMLELIATLRTEGKCTIEQIMAKLAELSGGAPPVSRSALARHTKHLDEIAEAMIETRDAANDILGRLGEKPESDSARLVGEMLKTIMFRQSRAALKSGDDPDIAIKDVAKLAEGLHRIAAAQKIDADRIFKIRLETAKQAATVAEKAIKAAAPGLSADTVKKIRDQVLGVAS